MSSIAFVSSLYLYEYVELLLNSAEDILSNPTFVIVKVPSVAPSDAGVNTIVMVPSVHVIYSKYSASTVPLRISLIAGGFTTVTLRTAVTASSIVDLKMISKSPTITGLNVYVPSSLRFRAAALFAPRTAVYAGAHPVGTVALIVNS